MVITKSDSAPPQEFYPTDNLGGKKKCLHFLHFLHLKMEANFRKMEAPFEKIEAPFEKMEPLNFSMEPPFN